MEKRPTDQAQLLAAAGEGTTMAGPRGARSADARWLWVDTTQGANQGKNSWFQTLTAALAFYVVFSNGTSPSLGFVFSLAAGLMMGTAFAFGVLSPVWIFC